MVTESPALRPVGSALAPANRLLEMVHTNVCKSGTAGESAGVVLVRVQEVAPPLSTVLPNLPVAMASISPSHSARWALAPEILR